MHVLRKEGQRFAVEVVSARYLHSWDGVPDKRSRCRECSSTKHFAKDCPTKADDAGKGKGKGKDGKGNQSTNQDPNQNNTNPKGPPSNKKVLIEEESVEASSSQTAPPLPQTSRR